MALFFHFEKTVDEKENIFPQNQKELRLNHPKTPKRNKEESSFFEFSLNRPLREFNEVLDMTEDSLVSMSKKSFPSFCFEDQNSSSSNRKLSNFKRALEDFRKIKETLRKRTKENDFELPFYSKEKQSIRLQCLDDALIRLGKKELITTPILQRDF